MPSGTPRIILSIVYSFFIIVLTVGFTTETADFMCKALEISRFRSYVYAGMTEGLIVCLGMSREIGPWGWLIKRGLLGAAMVSVVICSSLNAVAPTMTASTISEINMKKMEAYEVGIQAARSGVERLNKKDRLNIIRATKKLEALLTQQAAFLKELRPDGAMKSMNYLSVFVLVFWRCFFQAANLYLSLTLRSLWGDHSPRESERGKREIIADDFLPENDASNDQAIADKDSGGKKSEVKEKVITPKFSGGSTKPADIVKAYHPGAECKRVAPKKYEVTAPDGTVLGVAGSSGYAWVVAKNGLNGHEQRAVN